MRDAGLLLNPERRALTQREAHAMEPISQGTRGLPAAGEKRHILHNEPA